MKVLTKAAAAATIMMLSAGGALAADAKCACCEKMKVGEKADGPSTPNTSQPAPQPAPQHQH